MTAGDRRLTARIDTTVVAFLILMLGAALVRIPMLSAPLVEAHAFRQTQTAFTAVIYHQHGIDLFHSPLPILGPPWELPFEFPLFQAIAAIVMNAGFGVESSLRGTNLAFFLVTAGALWAMVRHHWSDRVAFATLVAFLFSPFALEWSRASMIEFLATAGAVGAAWAALRWDETDRRGWLAIALAFASLAALVKLATAVIWLVPLLVILRRRTVPAVILVVVPLAVGLAWARYADSIKATGILSSIFTSDRLVEWTLGSVGERLNLETWGAWVFNLIPLGLFGVVWIVLLRHDVAHRRTWSYFAMVIVLAAAVFPTLYARHSYYAAALSPAMAALLGGGFVTALNVRPRRYVVTVSAILVALTFVLRFDVWGAAFSAGDPDHELVAAAQIRAATKPDDLVFITGRDYSPAIFFYADRRGIMLPIWADRVVRPPSLTDGYVGFDCSAALDGGCRALPSLR